MRYNYFSIFKYCYIINHRMTAAVSLRRVLSVILGVWLNGGVIGIALAMCADWVVWAAFSYRRYRSGKWKICKVI